MNKNLKDLGKGDQVEIKFPTQDGVIWHLAEILYINADGIKVMFPSGHEKLLAHDSGAYRLPRRSQCRIA